MMIAGLATTEEICGPADSSASRFPRRWPRIAELDRGSPQFFDYRDSVMVRQLGSRRH